jgi:hippurate hydrolase
MYPQMRGIYEDLHANPELGFRKHAPPPSWLPRCASWALKSPRALARPAWSPSIAMASPTVMVRTELDALPRREKTGLPYASKAKAQYSSEGFVAHSCGHDMHDQLAGHCPGTAGPGRSNGRHADVRGPALRKP